MIEFIKLTTRDGEDLFLNMAHVSRFYRQETSTFLIIDDSTNFSVKETPEQILAKMKELQGENNV